MKLLLTLIIYLILFVGFAYGQTVAVPQKFVDRAAQSFQETIELRKAVEALETENDLRKQKDALQSELIASLKTEVLALKDQNEKLARLKCDKTTIFFVIKKTRCR